MKFLLKFKIYKQLNRMRFMRWLQVAFLFEGYSGNYYGRESNKDGFKLRIFENYSKMPMQLSW